MHRSPKPTWGTRAGLALAFVVALMARSLGLEQVFLDDGSVIFAAGDAYYHARRALFGAAHFPSILQLDHCINWPDGAHVPHPPGYTWVVGSLARFLASEPLARPAVLAWTPVVFGALTVFPIYGLGKMLGGRATGLGGAFLYAVLPIAITYSIVGNPDHHAAAALFGACLVWLTAEFLDPECHGARLFWVALGLAITRVALLATWHGSALYLPIGETAIILACVAQNRRDGLRAEAASLAMSAAGILPLLALSPVPMAGPWSATELSALHATGLLAGGVLCLAALGLERARPLASASGRVLRLAGFALLLAVLALTLPGIRDGLAPAFDFVTKQDRWGNTVLEQMPLFFAQGSIRGIGGEMKMGYYAYLVPLVPLAFVMLEGRETLRARALFLFAWSFVFAGLALYQVRFANDFAPVACVGFSLLLTASAGALNRRTGLSPTVTGAAAVALGLFLMLPALRFSLGPMAAASLSHLAGHASGTDRALETIGGTQFRFAQRVRAVTRDQPGCRPEDAETTRPEYGILAHPALGHALHLVAERATPADPFGPYIGDANYRSVIRFLDTASESEALAIASQLETPYVATAADRDTGATTSIGRRLHRLDGRSDGTRARLEHFRLLTEAPARGTPISWLFESSDRREIPYKLFEIVPGAVLEVWAAPGTAVEASLRVATRNKRGFFYRARGITGTDGRARIRVPYATGARGDVSTGDLYEIRGPGVRGQVRVPEAAIQSGAILRTQNDPAREGT